LALHSNESPPFGLRPNQSTRSLEGGPKQTAELGPPVEIVPGHRECDFGIVRIPFAFPPESPFTFTPEPRSPSPEIRTSVLRRVVHGEPVPDLAADFGTIEIGQRFAAMDVEVVHHQVHRPGLRILHGQVEGYLGKLERRPIRRGEGIVPSCFGLYRAEDIGRATTLILVVSSGFAPWRGRNCRTGIGVERNGLFM